MTAARLWHEKAFFFIDDLEMGEVLNVDTGPAHTCALRRDRSLRTPSWLGISDRRR